MMNALQDLDYKKLKHVFSCNDDVLSENTDPEHVIDYIDIGSVSATDGIQETASYTFSEAPSRARRLVKDGDIIISTVRTYLEAIAPVDSEHSHCVVSTGFAVLRPVEILSDYAKYVLRNREFIDTVITESVGISYPAINSTTLMNLSIPVPSMELQRQISHYLDIETTRIDALIYEKRSFLDLLKEKRQALISHYVTKGLDTNVPMKDSGVEWIGMVPEHWEIVPFKSVIKFGKGLSITKENLTEDGIQCLNYGEIHSKFPFEVMPSKDTLPYVSKDFIETDKKSLVYAGDIIFADTSEDIEGAGNFTQIIGSEPIFAGYHTVITRPVPSINHRYLAYVLESEAFRNQIRSQVKGVKVYSITKRILGNTRVWLPNAETQRAIASFLDLQTKKIDDLTEETLCSVQLLKEQRTALINAAVTGKIDVRNYSKTEAL